MDMDPNLGSLAQNVTAYGWDDRNPYSSPSLMKSPYFLGFLTSTKSGFSWFTVASPLFFGPPFKTSAKKSF